MLADPDHARNKPFVLAAEALRHPFTIGLAPIPLSAVLQIDERRDQQLELKRALYDATPSAVFAAEPGSKAAQQEAEALVEKLLTAHSAMLAPQARAPSTHPPLLRAALQTQEDLLLMARDDASSLFRLVAGSVSFPSSWALADKISRPIDAIHAPVPGFEADMRNNALVQRIFGSLRPLQPVARHGWSIYPDGDLAHPPGRTGEPAAILADPHLRLERQTLTKLPDGDAMLFTVRLHIQRLEEVEKDPRIAAALADGLEALGEAASAYKGLEQARPALLARLRAACA